MELILGLFTAIGAKLDATGLSMIAVSIGFFADVAGSLLPLLGV